MKKVAFYFKATSYYSNVTYRLCMKVDDEYLEDVQWPSLAAHLINKYGQNITVDETGFGYMAELPENAVLALLYILYRRTAPSIRELDEIVAKGTTKLHELRKKTGTYREGMTMYQLFHEDAVGALSHGGFSIRFIDFPKLVLYNNDPGYEVRVEFNAEDVEPKFLERGLKGELTNDERELLKGISLLKGETQNKYVALLSRGLLRASKLASALCRSAKNRGNREMWEPIVDWLMRNEFSSEARKIVVMKTLL